MAKLKANTILGGLLTIATVAMIVGAGWSTGNDIFYHTHPSVDIEDQFMIQKSKS